MWNVKFLDWPALPDALTVRANTKFGDLFRSPEFAARAKRFFGGVASRIGGLHVAFERIDPIHTSGADATSMGSALQGWAIMEHEADNITSGAGKNERFVVMAAAKDCSFS
jgi:hypothetical protein